MNKQQHNTAFSEWTAAQASLGSIYILLGIFPYNLLLLKHEIIIKLEKRLPYPCNASSQNTVKPN